MNVSVFKEFVRPLISSEENVTFASNLFSTPSELVIALAIIVSIVIVCALVFVAKKKQKRPADSIHQIEELPAMNGEEKMLSKGEPGSPQNVIELEELKGIGAKTAGKLKAVNIMTVSDLAKASANALSQKTGISEKLLSTWIEQANAYKTQEH